MIVVALLNGVQDGFLDNVLLHLLNVGAEGHLGV